MRRVALHIEQMTQICAEKMLVVGGAFDYEITKSFVRLNKYVHEDDNNRRGSTRIFRHFLY